MRHVALAVVLMIAAMTMPRVAVAGEDHLETRNIRIGDVILYIPPDFGFGFSPIRSVGENVRFNVSRNEPIPPEAEALLGNPPRTYTILMGNCPRDYITRPPMDLPGLKNLKCISSSFMRDLPSVDIKRLKSLPPAAIAPNILADRGPADANGWIGWGIRSNGQTGTFVSTTRLGKLGTPMAVRCWNASPNNLPNCRAGTFGVDVITSGHEFNAIALQGVEVRDVRWYVEKVERNELAAIFRASEIFIEWLSTPPEKRAPTVEDALRRGLQ